MTLLPVHIAAGITGVAAGFIALFALKGGARHRKSGMLFVGAMLTMSSSGAIMATLRLNRGNIMGGGLTSYLVATALLTTRRRPARVESADLAALLCGLAVAMAGYVFGALALQSSTGRLDGYPPIAFMCYWLLRTAFAPRHRRSSPAARSDTGLMTGAHLDLGHALRTE